MISTDYEYHELLEASERLRNATADMISYLMSGIHHQLTHDRLWQQMEEAREERWVLRSRIIAKASRTTGDS